MDTPEMKVGTTAYFGVNVEGAMFSIGDGHYRQGEGEACGTAVEGAMNSTIIVDLIKGGAPAWPRLEDDAHWMVVGSSRPMEDSWRISQVQMIQWLGELYGLDTMDAYQLLTQISLVPVANVVDTNYSVDDEDREVPAAGAERVQRDPRGPPRSCSLFGLIPDSELRTRNVEEKGSHHGLEDQREVSNGHRRHTRYRACHRRGFSRRGRKRGLLRTKRLRSRRGGRVFGFEG